MWMLSACAWSIVINFTHSALAIKVLAVAIAVPCQGEDAVFKVEVVNQTRFAQALGNLLRLFVFCFKGIHQIKLNQVGHLDLHWHGAAIGRAGVAHARFVTGPSVGAVNVDNADGGSHIFA